MHAHAAYLCMHIRGYFKKKMKYTYNSDAGQMMHVPMCAYICMRVFFSKCVLLFFLLFSLAVFIQELWVWPDLQVTREKKAVEVCVCVCVHLFVFVPVHVCIFVCMCMCVVPDSQAEKAVEMFLCACVRMYMRMCSLGYEEMEGLGSRCLLLCLCISI